MTGEENMDIDMSAAEIKALANEEYKKQNYVKAIDLYTQAIEKDPSEAAYVNNRSAAYFMQEDYHSSFRDALTILDKYDENNVKALLRAAKSLIAVGKFEDATYYLDRLQKTDPNNSSACDQQRNIIHSIKNFISMAEKAKESSDFQRVAYNYDKALDYAPGYKEIRVSRIEALIGCKKYSNASELAASMLRKDSLDADALYLRALSMYYQGSGFSKSVQTHLTQALRSNPDHSKARILRKKIKQLDSTKEAGNTAFKEGRHQEAYDLYTEALAIDPQNTEVNSKLYNNRSTVLTKLGRVEDAIADCTSAIELDESYTKAYLRRAKCYTDTEKYQEAVYDYEKASKLDPSSREVNGLLRNAQLELKKSQRKDYYKILGVSKEATSKEIKVGYRKMALLHHPDKNKDDPEAEARFKDVSEAFSVLSDGEKKHRYDSGVDLQDMGGMGGGGMGGMGGVDLSDLMNMFRQQQGGSMPNMGGMGGMGGFPGHGHGGHSHGGGGQSYSFRF